MVVSLPRLRLQLESESELLQGDQDMVNESNLSMDLTEAFAGVFESAKRNLVVVQNGRHGAGAGVIWRPGGIVVTNHHVIQRGKPKISLLDGGEFRAKVMEHKKNRKLALGRNASLYFEDRLTVQYQIQEMLRVERIYEKHGIELLHADG